MFTMNQLAALGRADRGKRATVIAMKTTLLEGIMPLADDNELMQSLELPTVACQQAGVSLVIGIEGPTKEVYRVIETTSLVEAIGVFETLQDLGLKISNGRREAGRKLMRVFHAET